MLKKKFLNETFFKKRFFKNGFKIRSITMQLSVLVQKARVATWGLQPLGMGARRDFCAAAEPFWRRLLRQIAPQRQPAHGIRFALWFCSCSMVHPAFSQQFQLPDLRSYQTYHNNLDIFTRNCQSRRRAGGRSSDSRRTVVGGARVVSGTQKKII